MENDELLQAIGEMLNPISDQINTLDARLDKIDARLYKLQSDLTELRISVLTLFDPVKLTIPRDIHSLSDDVNDISKKIQSFLPDGQEKGV